MKDGSSLTRFRQGVFHDLQRGAHRLSLTRDRLSRWFSNVGRGSLAYQHAIKNALKRHLLLYSLGCVVLLGGGLYWAGLTMGKQVQIAGSIQSPEDFDPIPIAGVHATILSIVISALLAYAIYVYSALRQGEEEAFQEADRINSLPFAGLWLGQGISVPSDAKNRQVLINRLMKLSMGLSPSPIPGFQDLPTEPAARGEEVLRVMSALAASIIGPGEPLSFTNIQELRQWVSEVEAVVIPVNSVLTNHAAKLHEILEAFFEQQLRNNPILTPHQIEKLSKMLTPGGMNDLLRLRSLQTTSAWTDNLRELPLLRQIQQTGDIARSVSFQLRKLDTAKKRLPKTALMIGLLGAGIAFVCGVMLPMVWSNVPLLIFLGIPFVFYIITFIYVAYFMRKMFKV